MPIIISIVSLAASIVIPVATILYNRYYTRKQLLAAYKQMEIMGKQTQAQLDQARRENAVEVIREWNKGIRKESRYAKTIVETFTRAQCLALYSQTNLYIDSKTKQQLYDIWPSDNEFEKTGENQYLVDDFRLSELRWHTIHYLNNLEIVMLAWKHNIADQEIIEEQFKQLDNPEKGKDAMKNFRRIAGGGKSYPSIEAFMRNLEDTSRRSKLPAKEKADAGFATK